MWKDLCIAALDVETSAAFWSQVLGLRIERRPGQVWLAGATPAETVWINAVPERTAVKNRVHLDVHTVSIAGLEALGARPVREFPRWTWMADPDGQDFCGFVRSEPPDRRIYEIVVDCADPESISRWWADVFGVEAEHDEDDSGEDDEWWVVVPGAPFDGIVFAAVPEPKTMKNRVHGDVTAASATELRDAGATLLRAHDDEIGWDVLADPEGNEFCVFTDSP